MKNKNEEGDEHHEEREESEEEVGLNVGASCSAHFNTQGALETVIARLESLFPCVGDMNTRMQGMEQRHEAIFERQ